MKTIPLTQGKEALVSDCDYEYLSQFNWYLHSEGYAVRDVWLTGKNKKKTIQMHREILDTPTGADTDHVDRDRLNNQRENLRSCTHSQNLANSGIRPGNKLRYKGVDAHQKRFRATIRVNYKKIHIGVFLTPEEAALAYNEAAKKYFGEFAFLNDIKESL